jgi:hypothetical protein
MGLAAQGQPDLKPHYSRRRYADKLPDGQAAGRTSCRMAFDCANHPQAIAILRQLPESPPVRRYRQKQTRKTDLLHFSGDKDLDIYLAMLLVIIFEVIFFKVIIIVKIIIVVVIVIEVVVVAPIVIFIIVVFFVLIVIVVFFVVHDILIIVPVVIVIPARMRNPESHWST